jgi:hypothetical protein
MVLQCINGVSSNPVEGRTNMWQLYNLILTLFGLIFRRIYIYTSIYVLTYTYLLNISFVKSHVFKLKKTSFLPSVIQ